MRRHKHTVMKFVADNHGLLSTDTKQLHEGLEQHCHQTVPVLCNEAHFRYYATCVRRCLKHRIDRSTCSIVCRASAPDVDVTLAEFAIRLNKVGSRATAVCSNCCFKMEDRNLERNPCDKDHKREMTYSKRILQTQQASIRACEGQSAAHLTLSWHKSPSRPATGGPWRSSAELAPSHEDVGRMCRTLSRRQLSLLGAVLTEAENKVCSTPLSEVFINGIYWQPGKAIGLDKLLNYHSTPAIRCHLCKKMTKTYGNKIPGNYTSGNMYLCSRLASVRTTSGRGRVFCLGQTMAFLLPDR